MTGVICGTGSCIPEKTLDNNDIARMVDTSDAWIRERTGVACRHVVTEETTVSMAAEAGRRALEDAGISPEEVELILVATISSNVILPCTACEVQKELGAANATCFDLSAACCGFVFAYNMAQAYIVSGFCRTALIIGSESLSNLTDWTDRGTCILFGDGAGAAILRAGEGRPYLPVTHSDGFQGGALTCEGKYGPRQRPEGGMDPFIRMDGRAVFQFAVKKVPEVIRETLDVNGCGLEDVDYFIVHQANRRIIEAAAKRLGADMTRFPVNIQKYGNTSSASIPILLDELSRDGMLKRGSRLVLAGFGAGLSWGAAILDWKK